MAYFYNGRELPLMKFAKKIFGESNEDVWNDVENYVIALEAERVEVFNARHYCQNVCRGDCRLYDEDDNCSAQDLWRYLRTNKMIKEAK